MGIVARTRLRTPLFGVHFPTVTTKARVFSGIQPTGELHLGNYLGAVRTWRTQIEEAKEETMFCVVDAHAITVPYDPKDLRARIDGFAIDLIACGVDPEKTTLFVQSDVREHTELVDALERHDCEAARRLITEHVERSIDAFAMARVQLSEQPRLNRLS